MFNKFIATVEKYNMLSNGDRVLVGVSGGADSMLLLTLLLEAREKYDLKVEVAHIEHGIRGEASKKDAEFVKAFCDDSKIKFHLLEIDAVREAKENKMSVEEYSRKRRYDFFDSLDCDKIATAHNLSDNIETVLFRLARGTGLKGICGIPPVRGKIIRPLIEISSAEIRDYCNEHNIEYRNDETNQSDDYSRNYIRHNIVEPFKMLNDGFEENFAAFIADSNEDYAYIENASQNAYKEAVTNKGLNRKALSDMPKSIAKRVLARYFAEHGVFLDRKHLSAVYQLAVRSGRVQISDNIFAVSSGNIIRFADLSERDGKKNIETKILKISEFNRKTVDFYCDYDKIIGSIELRTREAGDSISPAGRGVTKTLKKLYNENGISVEKRDTLTVICDEKGVIGVEGICCDERVKIDESSENVFVLTVCTED